MKNVLKIMALFMLFTGLASAAEVPAPLITFFDTIISIIVEKGILLGGIGIIVVAGIVSFVNKSWAPLAYAIVGLLLMVLAKPLVTGLITWAVGLDTF